MTAAVLGLLASCYIRQGKSSRKIGSHRRRFKTSQSQFVDLQGAADAFKTGGVGNVHEAGDTHTVERGYGDYVIDDDDCHVEWGGEEEEAGAFGEAKPT